MRFQLSEETQKARDRLASGNAGDTIDQRSMSLILGCDCDGAKSRGYSIVNRALKWCEKEHELVWRWDREEKCWRCLVDREKPIDLDNRKRRIRTHAKRQLVVTQTVDYTNLSEIDRAKVAVHAVLAAAFSAMAGPRIGKKLLQVVNEPYTPEEGVLLDACRKRLN